MTIYEILNRLQGVKPIGANKWLACCPCGNRHAHNDKERSLSITHDTSSGKILMNCFTGCTFNDICSALGISPGDLMPEPAAQDKRRNFLEWYGKENGLKLEAVYSYEYGSFRDGVAKVRFRKPDGGKTFRWIHADDSKKSGVAFGRGDNPNRLYVRGDIESNDLCFIVEGEKDADNLFSIMEKGIVVCTENGASTTSGGGKWRQEYTQQLEGKSIFILWDNDDVGRAFAEIEAQELNEHVGVIFMLDIVKMWPECPDKGDISDMVKALGKRETQDRILKMIQTSPLWEPGAIGKKDGDLLDFEDYIEYDGYIPPAPQQEAPEQPPAPTDADLPGEPVEALTAPQEAQQKPRQDAFESFMSKIQTEAYRPVKTGMGAFDKLLFGGIPRQSLIMLTAAPGAGKTTFCQQVFETAAAGGTDVIFINLEMSREQLLSRSLSRMIHQQGGSMNAMDIMRGYKWTDEQRQDVNRAATIYRERINPYMHYNPIDGSDLTRIMEYLEKAAAWCKKMGRNSPIAVIDYLHLITGKDDKGRDLDAATVIKLAVKRLKDWAVVYDSYVFAIGANNRTANSKGTITLESGRDTSAIEYSADIQLSLNYRALHEKRKIKIVKWSEENKRYEEHNVTATPGDPDVMEALQRMPERDMIIQVLKSRMIPARGKLYLRFNAANSTFTPIVDPYDGEDFIEVDDPDNPFDESYEDDDE